MPDVRVTPKDDLYPLDWGKDLFLVGANGYIFDIDDPMGDSPYDFITDPETGKRKGSSSIQTTYTTSIGGFMRQNLIGGVAASVTLPPNEIWKRGVWLIELKPKLNDKKEIIREDLRPTGLRYVDDHTAWRIWMVSGEGTPGNYLYRAYELPDVIADNEKVPRHPMLWPKDLLDFPSAKAHPAKTPPASKPAQLPGPAKGSVTQAPSLPAGVKFRCTDCGHWFTEATLKGHAAVCPTKNGGFSDWAIMCDPACGCDTLHQASTPMPGFPRPKKQEEVKDMNVVTWIKGLFDEQAKVFTPGESLADESPAHVKEAWKHPDGTMVFDDPHAEASETTDEPKPEETAATTEESPTEEVAAEGVEAEETAPAAEKATDGA